MPATPLTSPDTDLDAWTERLTAVTGFVTDHAGRFPNQHAVDPEEAELGLWWVHAQEEAGDSRTLRRKDAHAKERKAKYHDVQALHRRAEQLRVDALTAYVRAHEGRFPPSRSDDRAVAELGSWWVAQNIELNRERMHPSLAARIDQLCALAADVRGAAKERHLAQVRQAAQDRGRAATLAAGHAGALAAAEALKSPYLIPGDAEVLQLRITYPGNNLAELAKLAKMTPGQFATKYYGALHRGPNSRSPLKKDLPDRLFAPGDASDLVGVPRAILARWADAGLLGVQRNAQGHRRYTGAELLRVKNLITEGWPPQFVEAAKRCQER